MNNCPILLSHGIDPSMCPEKSESVWEMLRRLNNKYFEAVSNYRKWEEALSDKLDYADLDTFLDMIEDYSVDDLKIILREIEEELKDA